MVRILVSTAIVHVDTVYTGDSLYQVPLSSSYAWATEVKLCYAANQGQAAPEIR